MLSMDIRTENRGATPSKSCCMQQRRAQLKSTTEHHEIITTQRPAHLDLTSLQEI